MYRVMIQYRTEMWCALNDVEGQKVTYIVPVTAGQRARVTVYFYTSFHQPTGTSPSSLSVSINHQGSHVYIKSCDWYYEIASHSRVKGHVYAAFSPAYTVPAPIPILHFISESIPLCTKRTPIGTTGKHRLTIVHSSHLVLM